MKKYITISLFIFWAVTVAVIVAGLISYDRKLSTTPNTGGINQPDNITGIGSSVSSLVLSKTELAKHNSSQSCWLLISNKIYDVTTYLNQHPGNASTILPTCGTDATMAYDTKGRPDGSPHSSNAESLLANYFIGNLNQTLQIRSEKNTSATSNINTNNQNPPAVVSPDPIPTPAPVIPSTNLVLSSAELAKHNSRQTCWLLISGKIYDVTTYLNQHPGNASTILPTCGTDATQAYANRGGTGTHSSSANSLLAAYFIGNLNQTVNTTSTNPTTPPVANPNPTIPTSRDDDDDD